MKIRLFAVVATLVLASFWVPSAHAADAWNTFPVTSYGALCNGSHDDSTAFQNAVNAACGTTNGNGGLVVIPAQSSYNQYCKVTTTITFASGCNNVHLVGAGYSASEGSFFPVSDVDATTLNGDLFKMNGSPNYGIGFEGFTVEMSSSNASSRCIYGASVSEIVVRDFGCFSTSLSGIKIDAGTAGHIDHSNFIGLLGSAPGSDLGVIDIGASDFDIGNGTYTNCNESSTGSMSTGGHKYGFVIRGGVSRLVQPKVDYCDHGILLVTGNGTEIVGGRTYHNQGNGIVVRASGNSVIGHEALGNSQNANNTYAGFLMDTGSAIGNVIANNRCDGQGGDTNLMSNCIDDTINRGKDDIYLNYFSSNRAQNGSVVGSLYNCPNYCRIIQPTYAADPTGDANLTLTCGSSGDEQSFNVPLTANRTVTYSTTGAWQGCKFRVTRLAAASGASTISACGKSLAVSQWVDCEFFAGSWKETAFGSL